MIQRWLESRREGREQNEAEIRAFVSGVLDGGVTRAQAAAWLAFVLCRGMSRAETVALTLAMADSGSRLQWPEEGGERVDKHSTGGVGDKVSLVLAPLWAALGKRVPMLSGRGLGITGGTLDKMEAIPGYRTDLPVPRLREVLAEVGCFLNGQTPELAPADRLLYALRDETGTVPSVPLITASILSKKLAEGIERLVLDVKCGSGAFMKTRAEAESLAESLLAVGRGAGLVVEARISDMNAPLGRAIGNALEVEEAVACLRGGGPRDLRELVLELSGDPGAGAAALDSGAAYERWEALLRAQGGDPEAPLRGGGCAEEILYADRSGVLRGCDAGLVGRAAFLLGAGRARADAEIDPGVGILLEARPGAELCPGQPLARILHRDGRGLEPARELLRRAMPVE